MEPGEKLSEIVWDCQWVNYRCTYCSQYHVLHKGYVPPKCPYGFKQEFRALYNNEEQREHVRKIFDSMKHS